VEKDPQQAVKWFIRAARQGNKMAQHNLGLHYATTEAAAEAAAKAAEAAAAAENDDDEIFPDSPR
jgi:TPR repeat protein